MALYLHLCGLLFFVFSAHAHKCEHDEYVASHNIKATVSPQAYLNHPFEMAQQDSADMSRRLQAQKNWEPIRIHVDSSDLAKQNLGRADKTIMDKITKDIIPIATKILSNHLNVIRVNGNAKVTPKCKHLIDGKPCCGTNPKCEWLANECADIPVPESHKTAGIPNTDFVAYLSAHRTPGSAAVAVGATCRTDQYDRPLAGKISINLAAQSWQKSPSKNYLALVIVHEISHALGWSRSSFSKFRDKQGNLRANPVTTKNALGKTVSFLSTPTVTSLVRAHFGCNSVTGLEIEDQGGSGTAGSHVEKRIFPESYMSGANGLVSSDGVDAMALSVFQDSGWYQVTNLDQARRLSFGRGMGCRVATQKCNEWGQDAASKGIFCTDAKQRFCGGVHKHMNAHCNMANYGGSLPSNFQYFSSPSAGGKDQIADFCPRAKVYGNGDCTDTKNMLASGKYYGNTWGSDSRCFQSTLLRQGMSSPNNFKQGRCFKRTCTPTQLTIHLADDKTVACPVSDKATTKTVEGYKGQIVCPPYTGKADDPRCTPICSKEDTDCLGIKGGVPGAPPLPSLADSPTKPPSSENTDPPANTPPAKETDPPANTPPAITTPKARVAGDPASVTKFPAYCVMMLISITVLNMYW